MEQLIVTFLSARRSVSLPRVYQWHYMTTPSYFFLIGREHLGRLYFVFSCYKQSIIIHSEASIIKQWRISRELHRPLYFIKLPLFPNYWVNLFLEILFLYCFIFLSDTLARRLPCKWLSFQNGLLRNWIYGYSKCGIIAAVGMTTDHSLAFMLDPIQFNLIAYQWQGWATSNCNDIMAR